MWFMVLNAVLAGVSVLFGIAALVKPGLLAPQATSRFYAAMYASRAIPLGVATVIAIMYPVGLGTVLLLAASACAQFGDALIGACYRQLGMVIAPVIAGSCHMVAAVMI